MSGLLPGRGQRQGPVGLLGHLVAACDDVRAEGTDPGLLAAVLGWSVRPRRTPDALRRSCRDATEAGGELGSNVAAIGGALRAAIGGALRAAIGDQVVEADVAVALRVVDRWRSLGVRIAVVGDPAYPGCLAEGWPHTDGPTLLAWRGAPVPDVATVAIVGSRRATGYGIAVAAWLAETAARAGVRVVSGGAVGIDATAHEAAVGAPGGTTVVLGCGHAVGYPRSHARPGGLFDRIVAQGGTIASELLPSEPPRAGQVRARNRIVAALADVVVVVEGGPRSGALLTAGAAAERGRTLLAVPGDVRASGSAAPHRLLSEGVAPCTEPADLLAALPTGRPRVSTAGARSSAGAEGAASPDPKAPAPTATTLPPEVHAVLAAAWPRPVRLDDLAQRTRRPVPALLAAITRARMAGEVAESPEGIRLRRAPAN